MRDVCWRQGIITQVEFYRSVVSVSVVAVGLLGLSACGGKEPSGLPEYTPRCRRQFLVVSDEHVEMDS